MVESGKLYVVATPIGNLEDITLRAITVLKTVDLIAAEDTRQSKKLLLHYGITTPLYSLHAHNEKVRSAHILEKLKNKQDIAYVTDAGTPLVSDPGAYLVKRAREEGLSVIPIPGASAAIAALSVSGFMQPHFYFEGFLPSKASSRRQRLLKLKHYESTLIFYESPHRIIETLQDLLEILGDREAIVARELTKRYETVTADSLSHLLAFHLKDTEQRLGEFVILVAGGNPADVSREHIENVLLLLLKELPLKQSVALASKLLDVSKNEIYAIALDIKQQQ